MYYYIFIIIYITSSFSNGFIFLSYPLNENMELTDSASAALKRFFQFLTEEKTMGYKEFKKLLNDFDCVHKINNSEIEQLFEDENISQDVFMHFDQFKKLATKFIIKLENSIEYIFEFFSNDNSLLDCLGLMLALSSLQIPMTEENSTALMSSSIDDIWVDMKAFRKIFTTMFHSNVVEFMDKKHGDKAIIDLTYFNV
ncbi:uncharacterized protein LOC126901298 [Daktulosphaira vitifoliae]|uniref:uncharacterized protein LOC126901298 n=1 Tax=Daktulosphaira vitifoliae TaxID=58002 RepID=UPI0021A9FD68|nr:uncharacterized protein LOC126901298 [Daktulosphaira vitifoliae]